MGNDRLDILATNQLGRALFCELYAAPSRPANHARFVFLDPRAEIFYADWDRAARETAAILRTLFTYAAEAGSRSEEGLILLGSWAATHDQATAPALERE